MQEYNWRTWFNANQGLQGRLPVLNFRYNLSFLHVSVYHVYKGVQLRFPAISVGLRGRSVSKCLQISLEPHTNAGIDGACV